MLDYKIVQTTINHVGKVFGSILDESHKIVLPAARAEVQVTREEYDYKLRNITRGLEQGDWGYSINHEQPLRFKQIKINDISMIVDVYCKIKWTNSEQPIEQDIKVRVWVQDDNVNFRDTHDAECVLAQLTSPHREHPGRVVSRFHFDKANATGGKKQPGPKFHMQIGGKPEEYELCWHPESVKVPRLEYQPMELFLTCQAIAANFFYDDYVELIKKVECTREIIQYQKMLLLPHYQGIINCINAKGILLDHLWGQ